ncbi:MAG: FAD dependent oxidoreductase [candidate division BRC1 bacterium ADurb.BinA364]|nr:MAG: FAD dependent oxidoreductase [candidate division BRC1 bacterium ADurb.BinA364]
MLGQKRLMKNVNVADAEALTKAEIQFRREYFGALNWLKANMPGYEAASIVDTFPQIGVRQGRRVRGEHILTDEDMKTSRHFEDGVGRLGTYMIGYGVTYGIVGLDYDVPYRCLVPQTVDGLLIAGRCVSCDYQACNAMRLIVPCFVTGQAAGAAAAVAARLGVAPRQAPIGAIREALRKQDVNLG